MKVLHVLYQSYPNISGSSTRSADLINAQKKIGLIPLVITSPFQNGISVNSFDIINDVYYFRTFSGKDNELVSESETSFFVKIKKLFRIFSFTKEIYKLVRKEKPDIIHAHAMFFCAIPAKLVSVLTKTAFIYEIRSLWEDRQNKGLKLYLTRSIENFSARLSRRFIVINKALKESFIERGFDPKNIIVVPNAINLDRIEFNEEISLSIKSPIEFVFAYVGSVSPIEGLEMLIHSFYGLQEKGITNKLHIYGTGIELPKLQALVDTLEMNDQITFMGKFDPSEAFKVYREIDIVINPRIKSKITDSVTPLKPLEALAYGKLFVGSDVGGIVELISKNKNGIIFKSGDFENLQSELLKILNPSNKSNYLNIIQEGLKYVREEKSWETNAMIYKYLYKNIIQNRDEEFSSQ